MRADVHGGPEQKLQSEAGYIDARPQTDSSTKTSCNARPDHTLGQKLRFDLGPATSALPRSTDIVRPVRLVRFVPMHKVAAIGIGGSLAAPPLPHHRAYGSVHGGSRSCANTIGTRMAGRAI